MNFSAEELSAFLDRGKIRDCIARLARGEDRRDAELISASFWPEAIIDHGVFAGSFKEYLAWVVPGSSAMSVTQHVPGQSVFDLRRDTALVETHVTSTTGSPWGVTTTTRSSAADTSTGSKSCVANGVSHNAL